MESYVVAGGLLPLAMYLAMVGRLLMALLLGGLIGLERAEHGREAGIRTHIIVCLGSASVMVLSECLCLRFGEGADIMRLGAQVISGIGFLGVGCIITTGDKIKGLTTAAGLWTTACVGLMVGSGYFLLAASMVALMLLTMVGLKPLVRRISRQTRHIALEIRAESKELTEELLALFEKKSMEILSLKAREKKDYCLITAQLESTKYLHPNQVVSEMVQISGIESVEVLKDE